jgi:hypothetical protein
MENVLPWKSSAESVSKRECGQLYWVVLLPLMWKVLTCSLESKTFPLLCSPFCISVKWPSPHFLPSTSVSNTSHVSHYIQHPYICHPVHLSFPLEPNSDSFLLIR